MKNDHNRISPTAKITAYWRSLSDIPFSNEIAGAVNAEETARSMLGDRILQMGTLSPSIFEARYKSINYGLGQRGITDVMELACGLSPRGLEIASSGGTYVGTDLPDMLAESSPVISQIASRAGISSENLHLQTANVLDRNDLVQASGHFHGRRFAICNEGLLMYLDRGERRIMAENIRGLLLESGGCWITTDIVFRVIRESIVALFGTGARDVVRPAMQRIAEQTGRDLTGNDFADEVEARAFFENLGFRIEKYPMYPCDYTLSTASRLHVSFRDRFLEILSSARTWVLVPVS